MRGREPRNPLSETRRNVIRALVGPDDLQVAVTKDQVRSAPDIAFHGEELSRADESTLYHRFEMNHTPPDSESGCRLARREGRHSATSADDFES